MDIPSDIVNGIGVYLTESHEPVLIVDDRGVVFLTPHGTHGWTRDGKANSPLTRQVYGDIRMKLYDLVEPVKP